MIQMVEGALGRIEWVRKLLGQVMCCLLVSNLLAICVDR